MTSHSPITGKKPVFTKRLPVLLRKRGFNIPSYDSIIACPTEGYTEVLSIFSGMLMMFSEHFHVFIGDLSQDVESHQLREAFTPFGAIS